MNNNIDSSNYSKLLDADIDSPIDADIDSPNNEKYIFKANLCTRLSRELNLEEKKYDTIGKYNPPEEHGLNNCDFIIAPYYKIHENPQDILKIDYFYMIKDDIRNFRPLNQYKLDYIKDLSHENKNELFNIYNECIKTIIDTFM